MRAAAVATLCASWLVAGVAAALDEAPIVSVTSAAEAGGRVVGLPHRFEPRPDGASHRAMIRARFDLASDPALAYAVYLPELAMNAAVSVNGVRIGDGGRLEEPIGRNWNRPLYFAIPGGVLREEANEIRVELVAPATTAARLSAVSIGPEVVLEPDYRARYFRQVGVQQISVVCLIAIGAGIVLLVARGAAHPSSIWIAAASLSIAFGQLDAVLRDVPVSSRTWETWNAWSYIVDAFCFVFGVHRLLDVRARGIEIVLGLACLGGGIAIPFLPDRVFPNLVAAVLLCAMVPMAYILGRVLSEGRRPVRAGVVVSCLAVVVIGAYDVRAWALGGAAGAPRLAGFVPIVAVVVAAWFLLFHLRLLLVRTDRFNAELDARLADREAELAESHARLQEEERTSTLQRERERIAREMHDGVAAQLVSTVAWVESGEFEADEVADALREVLDEMRLSLDSLGPEDDDLLAALGAVRARLSSRIERSGVELEWRVSAGDPLPSIDPVAVHHVVRIVQEAITNALRHAHAGRIAVHVKPATRGECGGVAIEITDDGTGMRRGHALEALEGRGIANVRRRTSELGGRVEWRGGDAGCGTVVDLWLPTPAVTPR